MTTRQILLILGTLAASGVAAAQDPAPVATARGVEVVRVQPTRQQTRTYVKVVAVPGRQEMAGAASYEGTRQPHDWKYFGSGGPARDRMRYDAWASRFSPSPWRYTHGYGHRTFYAPPRVWGVPRGFSCW